MILDDSDVHGDLTDWSIGPLVYGTQWRKGLRVGNIDAMKKHLSTLGFRFIPRILQSLLTMFRLRDPNLLITFTFHSCKGRGYTQNHSCCIAMTALIVQPFELQKSSFQDPFQTQGFQISRGSLLQDFPAGSKLIPQGFRLQDGKI